MTTRRTAAALATSSAASRSTPPVPAVPARAHKAGLVDVRSLVPDAIVDLRYATSHNFTHVRLYPAGARPGQPRRAAAGHGRRRRHRLLR